MGTVYLIHFEHPIGNPENPRAQAQHYIGHSERPVDQRLEDHLRGRSNSSKIMRAVLRRGIGWRLARTWDGDRGDERRLKNWHKAWQLCPICRQLAQECGHGNQSEKQEMQG